MTETQNKPEAQLQSSIEDFESRIANARTAIAEADKDLALVAERRDQLAASAFQGDEEAVGELARLEEASRQAGWTKDVAASALVTFREELVEQKQRLKAERQRVARDRLRELDAEHSELVKEREEAGERLAENFRAMNHLHSRRAALANATGDETLQRNIATSPPRRDLRRFLERKLRLGIS